MQSACLHLCFFIFECLELLTQCHNHLIQPIRLIGSIRPALCLLYTACHITATLEQAEGTDSSNEGVQLIYAKQLCAIKYVSSMRLQVCHLHVE